MQRAAEAAARDLVDARGDARGDAPPPRKHATSPSLPAHNAAEPRTPEEEGEAGARGAAGGEGGGAEERGACGGCGGGGAAAVPRSGAKKRVRRPANREEAAARVAEYDKAARDGECAKCGTTTTPQWRCGLSGEKNLCNACGVKYRAAVAALEAYDQEHAT